MVVVVAGLAHVAAAMLPMPRVTIGLVAGLVLVNSVGLPAFTRPGIQFARGTLLRIGIVLLGAVLTISDVIQTGVHALALVIIGMTAAFAVVLAMGRWLKVPSRLTVLIGVGTAVCGNSAIIAAAPVIRAESRDVSYAVATITVFGTLAMLLYPIVGHALEMSDHAFGYWVGGAVNDTSQVTATGFAFSQEAGETATILKLIRNTMMAPLLILIGLWYGRAMGARRLQDARSSAAGAAVRAVPLFVLGFLAMAGANSIELIPPGAAAQLQVTSQLLILLALVGVGLSTNLRDMRGLGARPFLVGLAGASVLSVLVLLLSGPVARA